MSFSLNINGRLMCSCYADALNVKQQCFNCIIIEDFNQTRNKLQALVAHSALMLVEMQEVSGVVFKYMFLVVWHD